MNRIVRKSALIYSYLVAIFIPGTAALAQDAAGIATLELPVRTSIASESCEQLISTDSVIWRVDGEATVLQDSISRASLPASARRQGLRIEAETQSGETLIWNVIEQRNAVSALQIERHAAFGPVDQWLFSPDCRVLQQRFIQYDKAGYALELQVIGPLSGAAVSTESLNPAVPELTNQDTPTDKALKKPIRVALVDSGVNYTLPEINARLARDTQGKILGKDYWDLDDRPFDAHPTGSAFRIVRHGTKTASLLLQEAPFAELVPYRYPRPDMTRMRALIEHASENDVRVIGLPLGGNRPEEWDTFLSVAAEHPDLLFIASAGNNGRNIDQQPVYPASLILDNMLVVTSADDFVRPAERVNWGMSSVDYMLPAENMSVLDFDGSNTLASGSSYAVPRVVAMATRWLRDNPDWAAPELIKEFARRYADGSRFQFVSGGYIADPLAENSIRISAIEMRPSREDSERPALAYKMPLTAYVLSQQWDNDKIHSTLDETEQILSQCGIEFDDVAIKTVSAAAYLRDLQTGSARTVFDAIRTGNERRHAVAVFAHDTRMLDPYDGEAFGRGNTRSRAWLQDSVWLTHTIKDSGIALAHELFHVLVNSGRHSELASNLMQTRTSPGETMLTAEQCEQAITVALDNGLIRDSVNK